MSARSSMIRRVMYSAHARSSSALPWSPVITKVMSLACVARSRWAVASATTKLAHRSRSACRAARGAGGSCGGLHGEGVAGQVERGVGRWGVDRVEAGPGWAVGDRDDAGLPRLEQGITARRDTDDDGLAGSAVIQQRMTELLDVRRAILAADPNFYAELPDQQLVEA